MGRSVALPCRASPPVPTRRNPSRSTEHVASKNAGADSGAGHKLVIVESHAKARTIAGYLGRGYVV